MNAAIAHATPETADNLLRRVGSVRRAIEWKPYAIVMAFAFGPSLIALNWTFTTIFVFASLSAWRFFR